MSFNPKEFIAISKELENGESEAHFRSIINRAYYGSFGYLKIRLPISSNGSSVHQDVISFLKKSQDPECMKIRKKLEDLFKKRKEADYEYRNKITNNDCCFVIKEAEEIIRKFDLIQNKFQ